MTLRAHTTARVYGTTNSWSLTPHRGYASEGRDCEVDLEIQGNEEQGYHLVMSPAGFFTADSWYKSQDDALAAALELFGVTREEWR
jgi:hypothetical protein